jgi:diguanylate cyclase (GGDEF)-like protein
MSGPEPVPVTSVSRRWVATVYKLIVALPVMAWIVGSVIRMPRHFADPMLLIWAVSIAVVDIMPVPASIDLKFSLSFPLQLAVALIYPVPVAAALAFVATSDIREIHREIGLDKALFNRGQIALSVAAESLLFHALASLHSPWIELGPTVLAATVVGYIINVVLVAYDFHLDSRESVRVIIRQMHVGIFGEFILSYMGLALFGVMVAASFAKVGIWSIAVFLAPLAFARQMFLKTHSLGQATHELEIKQKEQEFQTLHDALTGLPNRTLFMQYLRETIDQAASAGGSVAVMIMDLNDFKEVNDTLGHHYGDLLLKEIGLRLQGALREGALIARLGGDEFGVVIPALKDGSDAARVAQRLLGALEPALNLDGLAVEVSASIGIALYPLHSDDNETLLRRADVAMYSAKEARGSYEIYTPSRDRHSPHRLTLLSQVRQALEQEEFVLHYQPKVELATGRVSGMEALIRWQHPTRGLVPPDEFIPLTERTVLVRPVTLYVLDQALGQWHDWASQGFSLRVAVNLSARNLIDLHLPDQIGELLGKWDMPPDQLILELTESSLMTESGRTITVLNRLSQLGIALSIDDFGTGYSSLSHLRKLPINEIKVDRSFVTNMRTDQNNALIVRATVDLGRNLGLQVVAEGIEDGETWDRLAEMGCDLGQGYYMSRPLPGDQMTNWLDDPQSPTVEDPTKNRHRYHPTSIGAA